MSKTRNWLVRTVVLAPIVAALALAACGSDSSDAGAAGASTGGSGGSEATGGSVTGHVHYEGAAQGDLIVAVFTEWPSAGAPELFTKIASPVYPQAYSLEGLDPGDYYIFAFIDVPPTSPTMPGSEDIQSTPATSVHVSDTEAATQDVTLPAE